MERKSYTYGMKLAGLLLHGFFTIVLTVSIFLLGAMISKDIFTLTDTGKDGFLNSGYYVKTIGQKCSDLSEYLSLERVEFRQNSEDEKRYLQYDNQFGHEATNFRYWCKMGGVWYTNQPDAVEIQIFDTQTVFAKAKKMGDYILYDMEEKEFSTSMQGLEKYFFQNQNEWGHWPTEDVVLVVGIDTQLMAKDDIYAACMEYTRLYPWVRFSIAGALVGLMGWILTLVYLTIVAGYREGESGIHLCMIDKVKTELLVIGFFLIASELLILMGGISRRTWDVLGLLVASGTVSFLIDTLFLIAYLSMVRRIKGEVVWKNSLVFWIAKGMENTFGGRSVMLHVWVGVTVHMLVCFTFVMGVFHYKSQLCLLLLLLFSGGEGYLFLRKSAEHSRILQGVEEITGGALSTKIHTDDLHGADKKLGEAINNIGAGLLRAVDDNTKNERMKADLITNVSHDIKTPLTSIINYVNLIKMEDIENERVRNYIRILDEKSQRLKQLTEDLVEASRISSGNVRLDMQKIDFVELVYQTGGEFNEKFEEKELTIVTKLPKTEAFVWADGRQLYRVIENLYNNAAKYALEKTRVYVDVQANSKRVLFSIKNVSEKSLAMEDGSIEELTERFVRGDASRTMEGSGLGLSIAKSLTLLMGGQFELGADGDLFKVNISFPVYLEVSGLQKLKHDIVGSDLRKRGNIW